MFGEKIDSQITMLQRVVALLRDLVIAMVALLTSVIVYFGGNPATLNALDWTRLVGAAFLIIIGPMVSFLFIRGVQLYLFIPGGRLLTSALDKLAEEHPEFGKSLLLLNENIRSLEDRAHPYLYAILVLALSATIFYKTIARYIP